MPPFMRLTHYTRTIEAVANILTHGFAWVPNKRKLIQNFVPHHNFSGREPQQFGMILSPTRNRRLRRSTLRNLASSVLWCRLGGLNCTEHNGFCTSAAKALLSMPSAAFLKTVMSS